MATVTESRKAGLFTRIGWLRRIQELFIPRLRRERERRLKEGIRWLVENPDVPVEFR
jgi:hypothetical protein